MRALVNPEMKLSECSRLVIEWIIKTRIIIDYSDLKQTKPLKITFILINIWNSHPAYIFTFCIYSYRPKDTKISNPGFYGLGSLGWHIGNIWMMKFKPISLADSEILVFDWLPRALVAIYNDTIPYGPYVMTRHCVE